jgi:cystathionine beta-lyase
LCAGGVAADVDVHSGGAAASLLSLRFDPAFSQAQTDSFCNALKLFKLGFSWAGPVSLAVPYDLKTMRQFAPAELLQAGFVRLAIGLESPEDLIADLSQALSSMA